LAIPPAGRTWSIRLVTGAEFGPDPARWLLAPIREMGPLLASLKAPPIAASYLCMKPKGLMTQQEMQKVAQLKQQAPAFPAMRKLALRFRGILQGQDSVKSWLDDAHRSGLYGLRRFAYTVRHDLAAVRNATSERWSNGQNEGHITEEVVIRLTRTPCLTAEKWHEYKEGLKSYCCSCPAKGKQLKTGCSLK
jgi:hypothetical protein